MIGQVLGLVIRADIVTKLILIVIAVLTVGSWFVAIAKIREFKTILASSRTFMNVLRTTGRAPGGDFWSRSSEVGHLARNVRLGG